MLKRLLLIGIILIGSNLIFAASFGLQMGWNLHDLTRNNISYEQAGSSPGYYIVSPVPSPHSSFETYVVRVDSNEGIFWIKGIGKDIETNGYGFGIKSEFEKLKGQLSSVYGDIEVIDWLMPGSIWDEPDDWMYGLKTGDRFYFGQWEAQSGFSEITIGASANSGSSGYISVEYYGLNYDQLDEKADRAESTAF